MSEKHLSFVCKQVLGHGALSLINQSIIIESEQLLAKTSMPITEIAEKLGFSNIGVFGRFFKRHVGLSPREYRTKGNGCV